MTLTGRPGRSRCSPDRTRIMKHIFLAVAGATVGIVVTIAGAALVILVLLSME